jgi:hypothetical protein
MDDDDGEEDGQSVEREFARETEVLRENFIHCCVSATVPYNLTSDRTRVAAMINRRLIS